MRKVTTLILLSAFLLNIFGFFTAFSLYSSKVGRKANVAHYQRLKGEEGIIITLNGAHQTLADLGFKKVTTSEYLYHGDHYDVVKREITSNGEKIHLKQDSLEDEIVAFLQAIFGRATNTHHAQNPVKKIFKNNTVKFLLCDVLETYRNKRTTKYIEFNPIHIPEPPYLPIHLPPPQFG